MDATLLLDQAIKAMEKLHESLVPNDNEEQDATVPAFAVREFVDAHATLLYERKRLNETNNSNDAELAQRRIDSWNRSVQVGDDVTYLKSELEGKIVVKTVAPAYLFGGVPSVKLDSIGLALLNKVELFTK